jgi:type IV pilus assembly protein PilE
VIDKLLADTMKKMQKGFTLVELMITLAVLAILVTIGYPLYNIQLEKGRRIDARAALGKLAMAQERHYAMFGCYADAVNKLNEGKCDDDDDVVNTLAFNRATAELDHDGDGNFDNYNIALATDGDANTQDFVFTATATGSQTSDTDCRTFTINQLGVKTAANSDGDDQTARCW